jgi:hypothetical protein
MRTNVTDTLYIEKGWAKAKVEINLIICSGFNYLNHLNNKSNTELIA